jgi:precorrin-2 dehydrogenase/sirohydrochlorin ferrochelatase
MKCGAAVTVVSPEAPRFWQLGRKNHCPETAGISIIGRMAMFLVIGATDDEMLNRQIHADAERRGLLCNIADRPEICNFILPAIVRRGDFHDGDFHCRKSPAFAKHIRKRLETQFGPEYGEAAGPDGRHPKQKLLAEAHEPEVHKPLFERLIDGDLLELVKTRKD